MSRHIQDTKPQMTATQLRNEVRKAINIAIADGKRQQREALKNNEYVRIVTTRSYLNGLEVGREILATVSERI